MKAGSIFWPISADCSTEKMNDVSKRLSFFLLFAAAEE